MESETLLARQAVLGNRGAFEELVRRTARSVYVRVYMEVGKKEDAEVFHAPDALANGSQIYAEFSAPPAKNTLHAP